MIFISKIYSCTFRGEASVLLPSAPGLSLDSYVGNVPAFSAATPRSASPSDPPLLPMVLCKGKEPLPGLACCDAADDTAVCGGVVLFCRGGGCE